MTKASQITRGGGSGPIVIPPETRDEWVRLVTWELWMGMILFSPRWRTQLIMTSPDRVMLHDVSQCYAAPPVPIP